MSLAYRKFGSGEPLVILHGLFGSSINWNSIGKEFSNYFTVYLIDQRNHGKSFHSNVFDYDALSKDLLGFIIEHQIDKINLLGHSMGGKVALRFSADHPEKLINLIIVDIGLRKFEFKDCALLDAMCKLNLKLMQARSEIDNFLSDSIPHLSLRQFIMQNIQRTKSGDFAWRINLSVLVKEIHQIGAEIKMNKVYDKPCLFITGENSDYVLDANKLEISKWFSKVKYHKIKDAGHWVHFDNPLAFVESVKRFLVG